MADQNSDMNDESQRAATRSPNGTPEAKVLHNSGYHYWEKYEDSGDLLDLQQAIQLTEKAVALWNNPSDRVGSLYNLAVQLRAHYLQTETASNLEKAFEVCKEGIKDAADDHPKRTWLMRLLGDLYQQKHSELDDGADLDQAVCHGRNAVILAQEGHPDRGNALMALGVQLWARFLVVGEPKDREEAMQATRASLEILDPEDPDCSQALLNLAIQTMGRDSETRTATDIDEAIRLGEEAIKKKPNSNRNRLEQLDLLIEMLMIRHNATRRHPDLDTALQLSRERFQLVPRDHPVGLKYLKRLLHILNTRYSETENVEEIAQSVRLVQEVTALIHHQGSDSWSNLADGVDWLIDRYLKSRCSLDLEEFITINRRVLNHFPQDHPRRAFQLHRLLDGLVVQYENSRASHDLDEIIEVNREFIHKVAQNERHERKHKGDLCLYLKDRFSTSKNMDDLHEAIRYGREAFPHTLPRNGRESKNHNAFIDSLQEMNWITGDVEYIEERIQVIQSLVAFASQNKSILDPHDTERQLCVAYGQKYDRTGASSDFEDFSQIARKIVSQIGQDNPSRYLYLMSYGTSLHNRYLRTGALGDLEGAIEIWRIAREKARAQAPEDKQGRVLILSRLQKGLGDRFTRKRDVRDLNEAIELAQETLYLDSDEGGNKIAYVNSLALLYGRRYDMNGSFTDLQESIRLQREVLDSAHLPRPQRAVLLSNLRENMYRMYCKNHDMYYLDEGIRLGEKSLQMQSKDHPNRATSLHMLGEQYRTRAFATKSSEDVARAAELWRTALRYENSSNVKRIGPGIDLIKLASWSGKWKIAYRAGEETVGLLSGLITQSLENSDKQHQLRKVAGLGSLAAGAAIRSGQDASKALELLEKGRGVLAASLEEVRADLKDLQQSHPELSERLSVLGRQLDLSQRSEKDLEMGSFEQPGTNGDRRFDASREFEELIEKIREREGYEDFLKAPSADMMRMASKDGPIEVINVSQYGCDAILVEKHTIRSLPLPLLNTKDIKARLDRGNLGSLEVLCWLWEVLAKPVLDALGFNMPIEGDHAHRMWWIPTGPLSLFPIHAAGNYLGDDPASSQSVLDRVISSYSSSFKAIICGRKRTLEPTTKQALLLSMDQTPKSSALPLAAKEINMLQTVCSSIGLECVQPDRRTTTEIMPLLFNSTVFHFAGHGHTERQDPSKSHLLVGEGGEKEHITAADLMSINLRKSAPFLAYLSACGTGRVTDEKSYDESIHLVGAFQLAGFRHVVGTLWEVRDEVCVDMAQLFYQGIGSDGLTRDESICTALHKATLELRRRWINSRAFSLDMSDTRSPRSKLGVKRGEQISSDDEVYLSFKDCRISENDRSSRDILPSIEEEKGQIEPPWVPFVHFGV